MSRQLKTFATTITINEHEFPARITGTYTAASKGVTERGTGLQLDPGTEATAELHAVEVNYGVVWREPTLPRIVWDEYEDELLEFFNIELSKNT